VQQELIARARVAGRMVLDEVESKQLVATWGVPVVPTRSAATASDARRLARELGLPAALKLRSPDVVHKSDVGGVRLGLPDDEAVERAFEELRAAAGAAKPPVAFGGVAVQPMAPPGVELLAGAYRDAQFGPVISFGIGGLMVEVYEDVAVRVAPLEPVDALEMIAEIRATRLLDGFRGRPPVDREAIRRVLLRLSDLMIASPDIEELDLNPLIGYSSGVLAVDARVVLSPTG
jgi:acyl-CoA synthetase (NDP forming)